MIVNIYVNGIYRTYVSAYTVSASMQKALAKAMDLKRAEPDKRITIYTMG